MPANIQVAWIVLFVVSRQVAEEITTFKKQINFLCRFQLWTFI